jgi:D-3-phosphoglycerate dehydrogenase / 2-oxoglutarate reductase
MNIPVILATTSSFNYNIEQVIQNPFKRKLSEEELTELLNKYQPEILLAGLEPITANVLQNNTSLKTIARVGIGLDNVDLQAAEARNIKVFNTPDAVTSPVAELTIGLMLSLLRNIHLSHASIKNEKWERPMGALLFGKTVGIIGGGRIGLYVARLVKAFGAHAIIYDPFHQHSDFIYESSLDNLVAKADIISLHTPATTSNYEFVNQSFLYKVKKGALLINTSRGELINENDLYESLSNGQLVGAALDVFQKEPYTGKLTTLPNVLFTAHIGSYAREARYKMEKEAFDLALNYWQKLQV